ncbi:MAG: hypothetical protein FWC91_13355, partial [Defluviitaleaceae bacterium]|nr:hypothetical protein [Defluviitaleaceae bacterium]
YDYFEIVRILRGTINNMISYTSAMQNTAPDFRSPSTQKTFGDIWANLDLLRAIDIQRVGGLVHVNNMSRNRERSANILEYDIVRFEMERDIARANAEHVLFLIKEVYEREQWVYHTEMSGYFTYHRFSDLHDNLIRDVRDFEFLANRLDVDIAFYQNRVDALRAAQNQANPQDVRFVEEAIPTLFESLREWEIIINQTVEDFLTLELYRDAVRLVSPIGFRSAFSAHLLQMVLITMAGSFAGLFLSILIALCRDASYDGYKQKHKLMKGNNYDSIE